MDLRADAVLVGVTALWGFSFVVIKNVVATAPPLTFLLSRFVIASVLAAAIAAFRRRTPRVLQDGAVVGLLLAGEMALQVFGQVETTASKAAFLTGLSVVLTPFAAYLRARRVPSTENAAGIVLASIGFVLLTFPAGGGAVNRGDVLMLGSAVLFAFYIVELGERSGAHDPVVLTAVQMGTVAIVAGALAIVARVAAPALSGALTSELRPVAWDRSFLASVLYLGSIGTVGTFLGQTWAQARMSATHAAILFALEPVFAALLAAWLLGERLGGRAVAGAALVLAGIVVSELRFRKTGNGKRETRGRAF